MDNSDLYRPDWAPPHCPSAKCQYHDPLQQGWRYKRAGTYLRKAHPQRIRRFRCLCCGVSFSSQSFSTTYWLQRPDILAQLPTKVTSGACNSQIAVDLGVSPATIDRHIYRLGRHCLLFHSRMIQNRRPPLQDIAVDGFASFEHSQYHPFHFHVAVDRQTAFFAYFTDSELRRSGRMTERQKRRRAVLERLRGRPDPQAVRRDMGELLQQVTAQATQMTIHSDDHKAYPLAIRDLACRIRHVVTSSQDLRDRLNKLFEINLLDLLIRHGQAEHKRETIAYCKRRNCGALKLAIFLVVKNYVKSKRVRGGWQTPAQLLGVCRGRLTVCEVIARRLFYAQVGLEGRWRQYYWQEVQTRALKINRRHRLKYAA
jgi:transposase-like protein